MAGAVKENKAGLEVQSPYGINKELFESATKVKNQLELLQKRLAKMEEHRTQVSDSVYLKVKTDYELQIEEVRRNFEEKCREIEVELDQLGQAQREQEAELRKHEEVLEEARFRHTLGEFTEKKFKESEKDEKKEISAYQATLEIIKGTISQYEGILGTSYTPQEPQEKAPSISQEVISAVEEIRKEEVPEYTPPTSASKKEKKTKEIPVSEGPASPPSPEEAQLEAQLDEELDSLLQAEEDYFGEAGMETEEEGPVPAAEEIHGESTEKVTSPAPHHPTVSTTQPDDDSISSILRDIPLDEESAPSEEATDAGEPTGAKIAPEFPEASLLVLEGDLDDHEIILGENTTIGRSPSNDLVLKESKVSRQHAVIHFRDGHFVIVDLKSSNGVLVNNKKIEEHYLQDGDEVRVGSFKFQFNIL